MDLNGYVQGVSKKMHKNPREYRKVQAPPGDSRYLQKTAVATRRFQTPPEDSRRHQEAPGLSWRRLGAPGVPRILFDFCVDSWTISIEINISVPF